MQVKIFSHSANTIHARGIEIYLGLVLVMATLPLQGFAQELDEVAPPTNTFAIEHARVIPKPGQVLENATVIIKDGLITAVGNNVNIPFDAQRIAGDSLTVYAGFIDGLSHAGIPAPKKNESASAGSEKVNKANPPNDRAGIQPERSAYDLLKADDKSISELRNVGFTTAHVVPRGKMLPGMGAMILLAGDTPDDMVLQRQVSMFSQLAGARGVYPATPMGVMAKMRQLFRESARRKQMETLYTSNATSVPRPEYDAVHYAFFPVLEGNMPVFMHTTAPLDIYRALRLQKSIGYPLILTGLNGGFESIDLLLEANTPLFLTLKLPEEPKKDASKKNSDGKDEPSANRAATYNPALHVTDHTNTDEERQNLEARRQIFHTEYLATAATMYDAGLNFGFSTKDAKPADILSNIRKMIQHGLTPDIALASLTTIPAETLGLSQRMGTIERGKMANLVLTKGSIFDEDTKIKYVFIDGQKFEPEETKKD